MDEVRELTRLNSVVARACAEEYILNGREAALAWLRGFWYGTGTAHHASTLAVVRVFGLSIDRLNARQEA